MASCEKCWSEATGRHRFDTSKSRAEHYMDVLKENEASNNPCTPKEQAGQFWDEENQCDTRLMEREAEDGTV